MARDASSAPRYPQIRRSLLEEYGTKEDDGDTTVPTGYADILDVQSANELATLVR